MKSMPVKLLWGTTLGALFVLAIATLQGYVTFDRFLGWKSIIIFSWISMLSFASYFVAVDRKWGWLFPALVSAALALNAVGVFSHFGSPFVAFPFLFSLAVSFYTGFLTDQKKWGWLIPAWFLTLIALLPPLIPLVSERLLTALFISSLSLPFVVGYQSNPARSWSLLIAASFGLIGVSSLVFAFIHAGFLEQVVLVFITLSIGAMLIIGARVITDIILKVKVTRQLSS